MIKNKICLFFALGSISVSSFAMEQYVQTCLTVNGNTSPYKFVTGFDSTDVFDQGKITSPVQNGVACRTHIYKYGPKKLSMAVGSYPSIYAKVLIIRDESCRDFYNSNPSWVTQKNRKVEEKNVKGDFILNAIPVEPGGYYEYAFKLQCRITKS